MNVQFAKIQKQVRFGIGVLLLCNGCLVVEKVELLIKSKLCEPASTLKLVTFC